MIGGSAHPVHPSPDGAVVRPDEAHHDGERLPPAVPWWLAEMVDLEGRWVAVAAAVRLCDLWDAVDGLWCRSAVRAVPQMGSVPRETACGLPVVRPADQADGDRDRDALMAYLCGESDVRPDDDLDDDYPPAPPPPPPRPKGVRVACEVLRLSRSVSVSCGRCAHRQTCDGRTDRSVRRALAMLRERCPRRETNYYEECPQ